jgi:hypothetical protein
MPRISDEILECSIYLYPNEAAARDGTRAGGTGFLIVVPSDGLDFLYAISNWHVVVDAPVVRVNSADGDFDVIPLKQENWTRHSDGETDIAAAPIALHPTYHRFKALRFEDLITQNRIEQFNVGIGDDVVLVGRFVNHEGEQRNQPTARFGMIAQMPGDKVYTDVGAQEAFLADIRSIPGYSGSPVFVLLSLSRDAQTKREIEARVQPDQIGDLRFWLSELRGPQMIFVLGIDCGHLRNFEEIYEKDRRTKTDLLASANTGMATIIPAWKITDLLNMKKLKKIRAVSAKEYQKKAEGVALDLATIPMQQTHPNKGRPIDIPIPNKADVMDVFTKATRKRDKKT